MSGAPNARTPVLALRVTASCRFGKEPSPSRRVNAGAWDTATLLTAVIPLPRTHCYGSLILCSSAEHPSLTSTGKPVKAGVLSAPSLPYLKAWHRFLIVC